MTPSLPWLYDHRTNVTSQTGEDGVLSAIFDRIGVKHSTCVEIGASDGKFISNSWYWINRRNWRACLVEADKTRYHAIAERYAGNENVLHYNRYLGPDCGIDEVLKETNIPKDFDFLSIDIDGMDYKLWEAMVAYRPSVVVIEVNCTMAPDIDFVQQDDTIHFGSSALAMVRLAETKGYKLAAHLVSNCIFVRDDLFEALGIEDNSLETLFTSPFVPKVVSDLRGVHHVLKEGAWGFSGAVYYNDARIRENGTECAKRHAGYTDTNGTFQAVNDPERSYIAKIDGSQDTKSVLTNFVTRMDQAFRDREDEKS